MHLSPAPVGNQATPQYVMVDPSPAGDGSGAIAPFAAAAPFGLTPVQLRQAYGVNNIKFGSVAGDGTGQTIAIIDAYDDPNAAADLQAFDTQFGLPAPPSFTKVNQTGGSSLPGTDPVGSWSLEESLDVQWAHAMAPAASIVLVEANSASENDLVSAAAAWAGAASGISTVSMSFGVFQSVVDLTTQSVFATPAGHGGVTFIAASGDHGQPGGFPAYAPNVVAVGGTTLKVDSSGNYQSETGWSGSGGGISSFESQPAFQKGIGSPSTLDRTIPDIALDADPNSGVAVYDSYDYGSTNPWLQVGGTSLSAPLFSSMVAIANQGRALNGAASLDGATQTLPRLYGALTSGFHDVTSGSNGFPAGPGYDLVTGLGTPIADLLVPALAVAGPYVTGVSPTITQSSPLSSITFSFSTSMDPTSFSVGADVASFVGPGGTDLSSQISGFNWLNGNTALQVSFAPQSVVGQYTMTVGPQILSATGQAMDQNQNAVDGQTTADSFAGTIYFNSTPTQVISTAPASGSTVAAPFNTLDLKFSAPMHRRASASTI